MSFFSLFFVLYIRKRRKGKGKGKAREVMIIIIWEIIAYFIRSFISLHVIEDDDDDDDKLVIFSEKGNE